MDVQKKLDESESERLKQSAKFEQARILARQYRLKFQTLEKEVEALKIQLTAEKSASEDNGAEIARLKQELLTARTEIEKQKQQVGLLLLSPTFHSRVLVMYLNVKLMWIVMGPCKTFYIFVLNEFLHRTQRPPNNLMRGE